MFQATCINALSYLQRTEFFACLKTHTIVSHKLQISKLNLMFPRSLFWLTHLTIQLSENQMDCLKKYNTYIRLNDFPGFPAQVSYSFLSRTPAALTARLHSFSKHFSNNASVSFETHKESRPGIINLIFPKKILWSRESKWYYISWRDIFFFVCWPAVKVHLPRMVGEVTSLNTSIIFYANRQQTLFYICSPLTAIEKAVKMAVRVKWLVRHLIR